MSEWPDNWFRDGSAAGGTPSQPESGDQTVQVPSAWPQQPPDRSSAAPPDNRSAAPPDHWAAPGPDRSSVRGPARSRGAGGGRPGAGRPGGGVPGGGRRWLRPRRIFAVLAILIALVLIATVAMYFFLDSKLDRKNILVNYSGRPAASAGQNWLIAGSDSRQGLTKRQERRLATGFDIGGGRSDTIMILHIPSNGGPSVLISLPRDSWVPIPGYGYNKINAAYSFGGPRLLAKTVQNVTGLRIDHYMGIGFGGFVHVVNDIGGVHMCIKYSLHDVASGLNVKKGCQTLDGAKALGYVRDRHDFANQDLQRVQDQRLFLKALLSKMTSAGVILNPFAVIPAAIGVADTLTVDKGTSLYQLAGVGFALRHADSTTVPISDSNYVTSTGEDAVLWNTAEANALFSALKNDQSVPKGLLTGSHQAS